MSVVNCNLIGRLGNNLFIWAFCRAYCDRYGHEMRCPEWVGEKIFDLPPCPRPTQDLPQRNEDTANGEGDITLSGYFQNQSSLIYTRTQAREWFRLKPGIAQVLAENVSIPPYPIVHYRKGDYAQAGSTYPIVSIISHARAVIENFGCTPFCIASEEAPCPLQKYYHPEFPFLVDFYRLMKAPALFRANSSFSYWAGVLSDGEVFSPVIDGLVGAQEHDNVKFVRGNFAKLSDHSFCSDLHLSP